MSAESRTPSVPRCEPGGLHHFSESAMCRCGVLLSGRERVENRPGMVTVYDEWGRYLGCMGKETWEDLVRDAASDGPRFREHQTHAYMPTYHDGAA